VDPPVVYTFGRFSLDLTTRQLLRDGEAVPVTGKVFDTLAVLVRHPDRVVGKDELMSAVWPDSFVSEDSLLQNISAIRRALGDDSTQPKYIATIPRKGTASSRRWPPARPPSRRRGRQRTWRRARRPWPSRASSPPSGDRPRGHPAIVPPSSGLRSPRWRWAWPSARG
jgi:hypothetical protein